MSDPAASAINEVRFLVGDPDTGTNSTHVLTDAEITFALDQSNQNTYTAAAVCARALAARYASKVDSKFETVENKFSQLSAHYYTLARTMDAEAKRRGALGTPTAGGISKAEVETVQNNPDRVKPYFKDNLFNNPPPPNE